MNAGQTFFLLLSWQGHTYAWQGRKSEKKMGDGRVSNVTGTITISTWLPKGALRIRNYLKFANSD